ncbi:beta-(1-6) glucans synthase [Pseudorhodoplanes sp.]|uniref:glycoside hydrolase family 17 protein n=1 Tax=Pseudorhodoplanes sp. TaxID=1934341 RepID=UPI002C3A1AB3|nr:beta-(1-6) glucans synthase [Pseudorhodoplanes sp.]HWV50940.1 beta-(1-6) glucans synthase [Pseudorhodoplanes sp.]
MHERTLTGTLIPAVFLTAVAILIALLWWWLGRPVAMPATSAASEKLQCLSYAPFRGEQSPLRPDTYIAAAQIEDDLVRLKTLTDCIRTYSIEHGLVQVPEIARKVGLKVIQGLWLSSNPEKNRDQVETIVRLTKQFPDVIQAVVVGNEVLLRGELSADNVAAFLREVKSRTGMPVTYADVWEFWLRHRDLANAVDFVTIHILPYWEDFPISAAAAAPHVESIRERMAAAFPGKEILIGETGWPSAGRMREGALPSLVNQALVLQEVLAVAKRKGYRVNVIEAFDQPWKRRLEGTVGGYWGLFDDGTRQAKFDWGKPVSNHPRWGQQAVGGVAFAALIFGVALWSRRRETTLACWTAIAVIAFAGGSMIGWAIELMFYESLGVGGWLRSGALVALAGLTPVVLAAVLMRGEGLPSFADTLTRRPRGAFSGADRVAGLLVVLTTVIAIQVALGLVFDPRYKDFPFAPLTAAIVPIALVALSSRRASAGAGLAERIASGTLALSAIYIFFNESVANWQSVWLCVLLLVLSLSLVRFRWPRAVQS